jgi:hypothetical protein
MINGCWVPHRFSGGGAIVPTSGTGFQPVLATLKVGWTLSTKPRSGDKK